MTDALIVYTTVADEDTASALADLLIAERVAACVQIVPGVRSVYRWQGRTHHDTEVQLAIKTTSGLFDAVAALLAEHHPYDLPEIVAVPIVAGSRAYLDWMRREMRATEVAR
jgi:periplasmic divalent cation tolerance protein